MASTTPWRRILTLITAGTFASGLWAPAIHAQKVLPLSPDAAKPFAKFSESVHAIRDSIVAVAKRQLGVKYVRGASSPDRGFDCSGLAKYVMSRFNISLPRTSREQALVGEAIERDVKALRPGDLLTFGYGKRISHVGIYIGEGKYVHANTPGGRVRESKLSAHPGAWWKGARRVIAVGDSSLLSASAQH